MLMSSVDVMWVARYDHEPSWKLEEHSHSYFRLIYFVTGCGNFVLDGREYPIRARDLFLIKPGESHLLSALTRIKTLDIKFVVKCSSLKKSLLKVGAVFPGPEAVIPRLLEQIWDEGKNKVVLFRELCCIYLTQILFILLRRNVGQTQPSENLVEILEDLIQDGMIRRVVKFLKAHHSEEIALEDMARCLGVTSRCIRERFQHLMGVTPKRYLLNYRVAKAKELMIYSDHPLKEIVDLVGFKSIHHFSRVFNHIAGVSPGLWRRQNREGIGKDIYINPHFSNISYTPDPPSPKSSRHCSTRTLPLDSPVFRTATSPTRC